jgi:hypothetical protein
MSVYMQEGIARLYQRSVRYASLDSVAVIHGGGSAANPIATPAADKNFLGYWTKSTAASGTSRNTYLRHYIAGQGGDGECLRAFTTVDGVSVAGGAHGGQVSLSFANGGSIAGLGAAMRHTLQVPNAALPANGTYAATQSEISCDGSSSAVAAVTEMAFHRFSNAGDATGLAKVDSKAYLFSLQGFEVNTGKVVQTKSNAAVSHTIKILIGSTPYWLMVSNQQ